jgi:hypothetical protein
MKLALWVASTMLLAAGTVVYLIWNKTWAWWLYGVTAVPFALLAARELRTDEDDPRHGGFSDGPWGAP